MTFIPREARAKGPTLCDVNKFVEPRLNFQPFEGVLFTKERRGTKRLEMKM